MADTGQGDKKDVETSGVGAGVCAGGGSSGKPPTFISRAHGALRGLQWVDRSSARDARFGRMFRWLPGQSYEKEKLAKLAAAMIQQEHAKVATPIDPVLGPHAEFVPPPPLDTQYGKSEAEDENPTIPAGYTYFGQFVDHDLTFDPNSSLQKQNDPDATEDFRTPRFDLDSLYGRGPDDQPYLYKDRAKDGGGIRFLLGRSADGSAERPGELPRNEEGRALIGDPRNDENAIVCQLQAIFLNFHNRVVDELQKIRLQLNPHEIFLEAQRIVRWHYQYLVLNDYLRRIVGDSTWAQIYIGDGTEGDPQPRISFYKPKGGQAYMPVEFSVAAFRFGHSMVRPSYALRRGVTLVGGGLGKDEMFDGDEDKRFFRIPIFSDKPRDPDAPDGGTHSLLGFGALPSQWEIDWNLFFASGAMKTSPGAPVDGKATVQVEQDDQHRTQPSYRIDTKLVDPLAMLPATVAKSGNMPDGIPSLAFRNLVRGSSFELPSGEDVARAFGLEPLTHDQLWGGDFAGGEFADATRNPFAYRAPLWFYILREAELVTGTVGKDTDELGGHHLGEVGGRIVAEVLVGIALNDHSSFLHQDSKWTPASEKGRSGFDPGPGRPLDTIFKLISWTVGGPNNGELRL